MRIAIYPGTFDPVTNGHIDIAARAAKLFDGLIVAVYDTPLKGLLFTTEERLSMMREAIKHLPNVTAKSYKGLTVDYARRQSAEVIVRGLRVVSDFELEFQMALINRKLAPELDLICLMTSLEYSFLSSSVVKEVAALGGCVDCLVPPHVVSLLKSKLDEDGDQLRSISPQTG